MSDTGTHLIYKVYVPRSYAIEEAETNDWMSVEDPMEFNNSTFPWSGWCAKDLYTRENVFDCGVSWGTKGNICSKHAFWWENISNNKNYNI